MMKKYEYKLLDSYSLRKYATHSDSPLLYILSQALNHLGSEGWKVIHFEVDSNVSDAQILMMREVFDHECG